MPVKILILSTSILVLSIVIGFFCDIIRTGSSQIISVRSVGAGEENNFLCRKCMFDKPKNAETANYGKQGVYCMARKDVYAYYFPNWHVDRLNEKWHGRNWTEWEVLKCARPRFEGHEQPRIPLWGYEDEADPLVMEKKIAAAKEYGIDGFIFDTYCYADAEYRMRCLDEGFLGAKNCGDIKFAVMWCNHDAIYAHPSPRNVISPVLMSGAVTEKDFVRITDMFIQKYMGMPNYIRVDGKVLFIIYNVGKLVKEFGSVSETARIFRGFRERVRSAGLGEMHLATVPDIIEELLDKPQELNALLKELGIDEGVRYWWPVKYKDDRLTVRYSEFVDAGIATFGEDAVKYEIPMSIHLMTGLDQSPRTIQSETYENLNIYPWYAVVVESSPEEYGRALQAAKEFSERREFRGHFVTVIWNEWTEGNFIEPDEKYGYGYLEAIRNVFGVRKR